MGRAVAEATRPLWLLRGGRELTRAQQLRVSGLCRLALEFEPALSAGTRDLGTYEAAVRALPSAPAENPMERQMTVANPGTEEPVAVVPHVRI